ASGLEARDQVTGRELWRLAAAPGAALRGGDVFCSEPGDAVSRLDAHTGELRWRRRLRGARHPAQLWPLSGGVLRALPKEGLASISEAGALAFRVRLPGGSPRLCVQAGGVLLAALNSGSLAALDPLDGRLLWKR